MNIFDPLISGSLSVSGSGNISGNLTVLGTINATISGTTSNAISASHAASYLLTSSFEQFTGSYTTGSFTGSFGGDGTNLINIPASGVTGLNLTRIADGSVTASVSNTDGLRVNSNTEITGALTISGSITLNGVPVGTGKLDEIVFNSYSSSNDTTNSLQNGRLDTLEVSTSSLNTFTASATGRLNTIESTTGSLNTFTSSASDRLSSIETSTGSLNTFTSSATDRLSSIETSTGSLNTFTSSTNGRLTSLESDSSSIRSDFNSFTSSNNTVESTQNGRLSALETSTGSLNSFTTSINSKIEAIETSTSSLNGFTSSINTTIKNRLDAENVISGSIQVSITGTSGFTTFSSSIATIDSAQDVRLNSIEGRTGSYATTGSNIFQGNQTITGSLFISENLIVGGSSSINFISQSTLNIGTNLITVNAQNPGTRFGGLAVIDSGSSPTISGSMLFDSIKDEWIFIHQNQGIVTSSVVLMGPQTYNDVGAELYPTTNRIVKSINSEHLGDSNISDNGTTVTILSNAVVNGTFSATGTTLVSGSSQINHNTTTNYVANQHIDHTTVSISAGDGLSGGGDITTTRNLSIATGGVTNAMLAGSIENGKLSNSSLTIGSTTISLGGSSATLSGLTSVTSTAFTGSLQGSISGNAATVTTNANLTGVVTSTGNTTTIANGNITNAMWAGSIGNDKLSNSSFFVGTTSISLGRASATQTLTGVSIDGNAGNVTGIVAVVNGGTGASTAASAITNLGATTVGGNLFTLTNPSAITFPRINANNTISALSAADFRTAIGAGTSSTTGTVTSVGGTGTVSGLSLSGTVTGSGNLTLGGTLTVAASNFSSQTANTFLAAPNGSAGTPTFRTIVAADIPTLNQNTTGTANNITAFTINQSVGTGNGVRFATVQVGSTNTNGGLLNINGASNNQVNLTYSSSAWGLLMGYGDGTQTSNYHGLNHAAIINVQTGPIHFGTANTSNVQISSAGHFHPSANNTYDCGTASLAWRNVFTNDLHLSNMNKPEGNDIDGTKGNWTIQEGAENLYIINNNNGMKFKILLEEV